MSAASTIVHDREGSGEPLVLIHGIGHRRQAWAPVVPLLVEDFEVITGEGDSPRPVWRPAAEPAVDWGGHGRAVAGVAAATAVAWGMFPFFQLANLVMVYLLAVVFVATKLGRGPAILASIRGSARSSTSEVGIPPDRKRARRRFSTCTWTARSSVRPTTLRCSSTISPSPTLASCGCRSSGF